MVEEARLRYEAMRDEYIQKGGKQVQESILRDLNMLFKNIRISAITVKKLDEFRTWRESLPQVIEYRNETVAKEIALRVQKATNNGRRKLSPDQKEKIEAEATTWVDNGVKATTNRRLTVLRAMFNFLVKRGTIQKTDVPSFPIANNVDNKRRGYLDKEDMDRLRKILPGYLHPFVRFLYATGMRSGQASQLTWEHGQFEGHGTSRSGGTHQKWRRLHTSARVSRWQADVRFRNGLEKICASAPRADLQYN